jgi:hypothetical protein
MRNCGAFSAEEAEDYLKMGVLNGLFVLGRSIGLIAHFLDQKRLRTGLYRHPYVFSMLSCLGSQTNARTTDGTILPTCSQALEAASPAARVVWRSLFRWERRTWIYGEFFSFSHTGSWTWWCSTKMRHVILLPRTGVLLQSVLALYRCCSNILFMAPFTF